MARLLVGTLLVLLVGFGPAHAADLSVTVTGVTSKDGVVRVVVIADPDGNARQDASRNVPLTSATDGKITTKFLGLAPGAYGVVVIEEGAANHAIELAVKGSMSAAKATSTEVRVQLAEPQATVAVSLTPTGK